jgi:hypothetical protein
MRVSPSLASNMGSKMASNMGSDMENNPHGYDAQSWI